MSIFKNLFSKTPPPPPIFQEGDVFYVQLEGKCHILKLLRHDAALETYHVLSYEPVAQLPRASELEQLSIMAYHSPIAQGGFTNPKLLAKSKVTDDDLLGYREYIRQTDNVDEIVRLANKYYKEAYALTTIKQHAEAIAKYTLAIELMPTFFEAIDNRAFCKMDLARWRDAIADFELSLTVEPGSVLAEFSIGECYLKMKDANRAAQQFEKALAIDPNHKLSQDFLAKARAFGG
jgi:tetratricopeptide (TPR) repeat protein